jgi:hypothetical protein
MGICRKAEWVRVVIDSEVLGIFVTLFGESAARNIAEWHKIV